MSAASDPDWIEAEPAPIPWSSGPWSLSLAGDELADVRFDGLPVLRSVRAAARDASWGTLATTVDGVRAEGAGLELDLTMRGSGATIDARLRVAADDATLTVGFVARFDADLDSNRTGLVVLHDQALAGVALAVDGIDGVTREIEFPTRISPHQPATDIRRLSWAAGGLALSAEFSGAVFEMEDQRNWCDASYKTYSGPLRDPAPIAFRAGDAVEQVLVLSAARASGVPTDRRTPRSTSLRLRETGAVVPQLQLGASTAPDPLPPVPSLPDSALLLELDAAAAWWPSALERARAEAGALPLDVRIAAGSPAELGPVLDALGPVLRLGVVDRSTHVTTSELWAVLDARTERTAGTRGHFAQLNRTVGELPPDAEALAFSVTPQVHARERRQLVESIAGMRTVALDALRLADGRPLDIGPVTLRPRITIDLPGEPGPRPDVSAGYGPQDVPGATDARMAAPAMVAWTVAAAAALAQPGVRSLTLFETSGPRGIVDARGVPLPLFAAMGALHALSGSPLLTVDGDRAPDVWMLAAGAPGGPLVLAANLGPEPRTIEVEGMRADLAPWSAATVSAAGATPLQRPIDSGETGP